MKHIHNHTTDYSWISQNIIVGSDLCKGWTCPVHSKEFEKLSINTEIDLETEHNEPITPGLDIYLRLPTPDKNAPTQEQLMIASDTLHITVREGKRAYVHCRNGHGRSPTAVAAYLIRFQNMRVDAAVALIKKKRPEIHIEKAQLEALETFGKEVNKI